MRYLIGCEMTSKTKEKEDKNCNGLLAIRWTNEIVNYSDLENTERIKHCWFYCVDNLEDAKKLISKLSRAYRRDDVWANSTIKSRYIRKWYLVKYDSTKNKLKLDFDNPKQTNNKHKYLYKAVI